MATMTGQQHFQMGETLLAQVDANPAALDATIKAIRAHAHLTAALVVITARVASTTRGDGDWQM